MSQTPSQNAVDRIRRSVRYTESQSLDLAGGKRGQIHRPAEMWAIITGNSFDGGPVEEKRYSWVRAIAYSPQDSAGKTHFIADPDIKGTLNAFEATGRYAAPGAVVRLTLVGYDGDGETPVYSFVAPGNTGNGMVPNHDHRDAANGGFAFAVYHPGTSLPQQPWAT